MSSRPTHPEISRRSFLVGLIGVLGGAMAAAVGAPIIGYFLSPAWKPSTSGQIVIGRLSELTLNEPRFTTYEERIRDGWYINTLSKGAWLLTKDGKTVTAYDPHCTHLNCPYYWDDGSKRFLCPCHSGVFDIDGNVLGGPPPRPLDRLETFIEDGNIVTTGKILRQV